SAKTQLRVVEGVRSEESETSPQTDWHYPPDRVIHLHCGDTCAVLTVRALTEREEGKQQPHDSKDTLSLILLPQTLPAWRSLPVCRRSYRDVARSALPLDDPL
ncbi:Ribosomal large subunit pseudouridine synthase D, partial [Dissostichus eleginoides]